ncbi:prepilin peptidase [Candidatus Woesearchaeota archaeon]|nr:prepilin peptidase [Candidatus Woesearchaeota archaeon]
MYDLILFILGFIVILAGSLTDLKNREVPDWLNYGLILGVISLRGIYSVYLYDYNIFLSGLLGLGVAFLLACLLFYTGQWGGGDAKLLMGLGAVFGLTFNAEVQLFFIFLFNLVIFGSIYGLVWTFYLFIANWSKTGHEFVQVLKTRRANAFKIPIFVISLISLVSSFFLIEFRYPLWLLSLASPLMFYMWVYTKVIENVAMLKKVLPSMLTEGDWIAEDILSNGKKIAGPSDLGINKKQISILNELYKKKKINLILIKEGIPFIPSFLIAYVVTLVLGNWILFLL